MKVMTESIDPAKFALLIETSALINSNYADAKTLLTQIIEFSARLVDAEAASLVLYQADKKKLRFEVASGPRQNELTGQSIDADKGVVGWVVQQGKALIVNDPESDIRFSPDISRNLDFPTRSILAVPMKIKGKLVGVIEVINKKGNRYFLEEDLKWLEYFALQAAIAIENARFLEKARNEIAYLSEKAQELDGVHEIVCASHIMLEKVELADRIAPSDASVLILGESGVGKELFAERIHRNSKRRDKPFIKVNCAALPETLLESELFGHVKGAFTDAIQDRVGRFEAADGGTIFLDEIAEMSLKLQAKLLRVLQQKSFERVGSSQTKTVDIRIIAATNRDLETMVEQNLFRADLYYRLNVLPLWIPPLRERKDDIPVLADLFLKRYARETNKSIQGFSDTAMELMLSYSWPGNVRELENAIERAVVMSQDSTVSPADLMLGTKTADIDEFRGKNLKDAVNIFKTHFIRKSLELHGWNQTETAKSLQIQRTYLSRLVKELSIAQPKE